MEQMALGTPLNILLVSTGVTTKTSLAVEGVKERRKADRDGYYKIFTEAEEVVQQAKLALSEGKLETVGQLMDQNHELLQKIGLAFIHGGVILLVNGPFLFAEKVFLMDDERE